MRPPIVGGLIAALVCDGKEQSELACAGRSRSWLEAQGGGPAIIRRAYSTREETTMTRARLALASWNQADTGGTRREWERRQERRGKREDREEDGKGGGEAGKRNYIVPVGAVHTWLSVDVGFDHKFEGCCALNQR